MVSIIIVNYNTGKFIFNCISSIKKYAPKNTEVIVIDNNSTDGSKEQFKNQKSKIKIISQKLKLIENKQNVGFARAVNQGIKVARGDYIFVLNPDTKLTKGALDALLNFTLLHKGVIAGPRLLNPGGSVQSSCYHQSSIIGAIKEYLLGIKGTFDKYAPKGQKPVRVDAVVGAAMFIPRKIIEKVGFFDERYFMYFEDLDYCRRVRFCGFSIYYLPSSQIYHEHGGVTQTVGEKAKLWLVESSKMYHGVINHTLLTVILWLGQKWRKIIS